MSDNMMPYSSGLDLVDERFAHAEDRGHICDPQLGASDPANGILVQLQVGRVPRVLCWGNGQKMIGIYAGRDATEMMKVLAFGDDSNFSLVDHTVSRAVLPVEIHPGVTASGISWHSITQAAFPDMTEGVKAPVFFSPLVKLVHAFQAPMNMACSKRGWLTTAAEAKRYVRQRVTSLVEVARKGLVEWISTGPSFYLDATLKEVTHGS